MNNLLHYSTDNVAKALTVLGRLVKTTYLLRYLHDESMRQRIQTQLNRGNTATLWPADFSLETRASFGRATTRA